MSERPEIKKVIFVPILGTIRTSSRMRPGILLSQVRNPFVTPSAIGYVDSHVNSKNSGTAPINVIEPSKRNVDL